MRLAGPAPKIGGKVAAKMAARVPGLATEKLAILFPTATPFTGPVNCPACEKTEEMPVAITEAMLDAAGPNIPAPVSAANMMGIEGGTNNLLEVVLTAPAPADPDTVPDKARFPACPTAHWYTPKATAMARVSKFRPKSGNMPMARFV
jgi:hypothetical protein